MNMTQNLKTTYIKSVIAMFAKGRYSRSTEERVACWLTNGNDSDVKEEALGELWDSTLSEPADETAAGSAYSRWSGNASDSVCAVKGRTRVRDKRDKKAFYIHLWQGVAACLLLAVGVLGSLLAGRRQNNVQMVQAYCQAGQTTELTLPDGTEVMLNGSTSLVYPERFEGDCREVMLLGEANFKVAKDAAHPFVVKSNGVNVTALGTEFNFKSYPSQQEVRSTLLEGKVKVTYGDAGEMFVLHPSEQLTYNRLTGVASITHPHINDVTAWQRGEMVFSNATLSEILGELEVRFSSEFIYNRASLSSDRYTFRFKRGMTLDEVMGIVSDVVGNISVSIDHERSCCKIRCI